ncbi:putative cadmium/zinc-transporting ATPase HMA1, chloroplastic [Vitis vinifera]|uniref:Putative cadmium/zinc-transporting ATPase HMA1, chloroplastic n=1 Tax=Vitis vinifera TaxID=29760 RepID=A0A438KR75_VITVI|nr:putative cadmium/zinc-transporting ATPase HMA1, chloroplastic [Vitis vinifera]
MQPRSLVLIEPFRTTIDKDPSAILTLRFSEQGVFFPFRDYSRFVVQQLAFVFGLAESIATITTHSSSSSLLPMKTLHQEVAPVPFQEPFLTPHPGGFFVAPVKCPNFPLPLSPISQPGTIASNFCPRNCRECPPAMAVFVIRLNQAQRCCCSDTMKSERKKRNSLFYILLRMQAGILLKGGHVLDALASCHTIAFDKTGTLTSGKLTFKAIEPIYGHGVRAYRSKFVSCCIPSCEIEALAVAAAMERGTTHPIGRAVVDHCVGKDLPPVAVENFESLPGRGLSATLASIESGIGGGELLKASIGSLEYILSLCKSEDELKKIKEAVSTSSYGSDFVHAALSVNKKVTLLHFEDEPRPGVLDVILALQDQAKLRVMMLTGDHESSAWRVANAVGIKEVYCSLKPEDKLNHVKSISREAGGGLIMVGDGINDAPALAAATVGIVLAQRASGTAIAVADVLLLRDNISAVPFCVSKSRQTTSLVKQNVALALSCILLASLPSVLGFLPLWLTTCSDISIYSIMELWRIASSNANKVLLHEGGTLLVCLNSVRALNEPTWSWKQDLLPVVDKFKSTIMFLRRHTTTSSSTRAAPL